MRKIGPIHVAEPGLTAGGRWQVAGGRQNTGEFGIFLKSLYIKKFDFLLHLTKLHHRYSSRNAFQVFLNQDRVGLQPARPGFLKLILCGSSVCVFAGACVCVCVSVCVFACACVCVCVSVCVPTPKAINN